MAEQISKNRLPIMGAAALWVMLFHGTMNIPIPAVDVFIKIGYLGVDIFMFMSGFSMSNSFRKSGGVREFYIHRLRKILPTFIPFALIWYANYLTTEYGSIEAINTAAHTGEFWITIIIFRWFIPAICLCYLITPVIEWIFHKINNVVIAELLMILSCSICALPFVYIGSSVALMVLVRIPEYIIGYRYGLLLGNDNMKPHILMREMCILILYFIYYNLLSTFSDAYLLDTGLYWWPAIPCISSMVVCLSICRWCDNKLFVFMGQYSLELYLWHVFILFPWQSFLLRRGMSIDKYGIFINLFSIFIACIVAWLYAGLVKAIMKLITKGHLH